MNNAAVIGRQLRRQKHYRGSYQAQNNSQNKEKRNCIAELRERITVECIVKTCKAFSIGSFVFSVGLSMMVVGFYAEPLSTYVDVAANGTRFFRVDISQRTGLEYLTYVGPIIMGIGGITLVAAYVFTFGMKESTGAKVVPVTAERLTGVDSLFRSKPVRKRDTPDLVEQAVEQTASQRVNALTKPEISPVIILQPSCLQQLLPSDQGGRTSTPRL
ncbi:uncharacterized protein LOC111083732 [Limulus polyphemus]|uniref:Uncharacterized protein LOC111083732 n=1 Tax=Limulus polyphemus TaxID=6850 RepID=A0ABM1RXK0_LIMPO|nr:uncharacterized protein LOC111083732 [Limulus polyphemus]